MDILFVCQEIPSYWNSSTNRTYYFLKYNKKYRNNITLITYKNNKTYSEENLQKYAEIITIEHPSKLRTIIDTCLDCIIEKKIRFPFTTYSLDLEKKLKKIIREKKFDLIYFDTPMIYYASKLNINVPIILNIIDPKTYSLYQIYLKEKRFINKVKLILNYYDYRFFYIPKYKDFNAYLFVSPIHKRLIESFIPISRKKICIPQGVDIESFQPILIDEDPQRLVFIGTMDYFPNEHAILFFYKKIFPLIKQQIPQIKLYVVGRNPSKEILKMRSKNVSVTGFVQDIRPFIAKACVVIVPIITDDGGFKIKVLEAMALGKPVVSTSIGAKGLDVTKGVNIIIADTPEEFANSVITLMKDKQLRQEIGKNARYLIIHKYSWEKLTDMLNVALHKIAKVN
jgi:glycosyltransferase involved in cell wall biosynthesis